MAASIYATPPPDLIGEDTGELSDSSSSSALANNTTNNNNNSSKSTANGLTIVDTDNPQPFDTTGEYITQLLG